ncbi:hypothetical protein [Massilia sp. BKSP1R2A-1]|uniref:hypothetical protein n=1 Tax=Massilia sp. BKSP1R2A-1 TaxID=3422595 RepID=UPI003D350021
MIASKKYEDICSIQELTSDEVDQVSGGLHAKGAAALATAASIGAVTFGSGWGAVAVGVAWAAAPVAVVGMGLLIAYGTYQVVKK